MVWIDWYKTVQEGLASLLSGTDEEGTAVPGVVLAATEKHLGQVGGHAVVLDVSLSLDTSAYAAGDVLAEMQEVAGALRTTAGSGVIQSLVVLDKDDQAEPLDIVFMTASGSLGTENAAVSISDADAAKIIGVVEIAAGDYVDLANSRIAVLGNLSLLLDGPTGTSIWVGAISRGTGTYTASGITLRIGILED